MLLCTKMFEYSVQYLEQSAMVYCVHLELLVDSLYPSLLSKPEPAKNELNKKSVMCTSSLKEGSEPEQ